MIIPTAIKIILQITLFYLQILSSSSLSTNPPGSTRRLFCQNAATVTSALIMHHPSKAIAAETVGKDPNCNDSLCFGVWDGLLADCPHGKIAMNSGAGCASSQDDTPGVFAEP